MLRTSSTNEVRISRIRPYTFSSTVWKIHLIISNNTSANFIPPVIATPLPVGVAVSPAISGSKVVSNNFLSSATTRALISPSNPLTEFANLPKYPEIISAVLVILPVNLSTKTPPTDSCCCKNLNKSPKILEISFSGLGPHFPFATAITTFSFSD